jgi:exosortase
MNSDQISADILVLQKNRQPLRRTGRLKCLFLLTLVIISFAILYSDVVAHTVRSWSREENSHGPLIFIVSLYLIYIKRLSLRELPVQSGSIFGGILTGVGCLALLAGRISSTMIVQQFSLILTLLGIIWLLLGVSFFRSLFLPISYFIFMMGFLEELLGTVSVHLQNIGAQIATAILNSLGMPVLLNGTIIQLPHITLEVARVCSGISHISALLALVVPVAYTFKRSTFRVICLCVTAIFTGLLANGLRIALIGFWTRLYPGGPLHGPGETLFVSFIFFFGAATFFVMSAFFRKRDSAYSHDTVIQTLPKFENDSSDRNNSDKRIAASAFIGLAIILTTLYLSKSYEIAPVYLRTPLSNFPDNIDGFKTNKSVRADEAIRSFPPDEEIFREYMSESGEKFELYLGYYRIQDQAKKLIDYRRERFYEGSTTIEIASGRENFKIQKSKINGQDLYLWYVVDGNVFTSRYEGKIRTFLGALFNHRTNGAVVLLKTKAEKVTALQILNTLVPMTQQYVANRP